MKIQKSEFNQVIEKKLIMENYFYQLKVIIQNFVKANFLKRHQKFMMFYQWEFLINQNKLEGYFLNIKTYFRELYYLIHEFNFIVGFTIVAFYHFSIKMFN